MNLGDDPYDDSDDENNFHSFSYHCFDHNSCVDAHDGNGANHLAAVSLVVFVLRVIPFILLTSFR
ncbi:hypothetical protein BVX98_00745 [bacterium F11]|nr:hypothetical protein BVX98_00745 [bacterium F11]